MELPTAAKDAADAAYNEARLSRYVRHPYQPSKLVFPLTDMEERHARLDCTSRVYSAREAVRSGDPSHFPYRPYEDPKSLLGKIAHDLEESLDAICLPSFEEFVCTEIQSEIDRHEQVPRVCKRKKEDEDPPEMPWNQAHEIRLGPLTRDVYPEGVDGLLTDEVESAIECARFAMAIAEKQIEEVKTELANVVIAVGNAVEARYDTHPELGAALKELKESRFAYNKCLWEHVEREGLCAGKQAFDSMQIGAAWCHILAESRGGSGRSVTYEDLHLQRPETAGFTPRKKKAKKEAEERRLLCACVEEAVDRMAKANKKIKKAYHDHRAKPRA